MPGLDRALSGALSIADIRALARRNLPRFVFEFIDGGAEDELTLARNRADFESIGLLPRVLVDVSRPSLATSILGAPAAAPMVVSPMGSCSLGWPDADVAIARAAAAHGIPYTLSTMATTSLETLARTVPGRLWFQLYVLRDRTLTASLVDRANAAGYEALVVTLDLPTGGKRERDLRNGITVPLRLGPTQLLQIMARPGWALRTLRQGSPRYENVRDLAPADGEAGLTIAAKVGQMLDAAFGWDDLQRVRDAWPRKLVVKGVQHPRDADRLAAMGVDCIWVSNHGGRQLDGATSAIGALPAVARAVRGRSEVMIDSGIRRGVDVVKALASGANHVAFGRPALFGACAGGERGAHRALAILIDEMERAMKLCGTPDTASIARSRIVEAPERRTGSAGGRVGRSRIEADE
jgi:L-lactate dehydrogenase (cytochrome)/(S)-mandelate dehydrogenase